MSCTTLPSLICVSQVISQSNKEIDDRNFNPITMSLGFKVWKTYTNKFWFYVLEDLSNMVPHNNICKTL